jgi:predicted PurR-regulated permease PerM
MALVAVVIWLLYQVRVVVIPLMLGAFLASLGTPLVGRLERRGLPRLLATWIAALGSVVTPPPTRYPGSTTTGGAV